MEQQRYLEERKLIVCNSVGVCPMTRAQLIEKLFSLPTEPVSATVDLVGVPAIISAKENPEYQEMYNNATLAIVDGMPIVKMARRRKMASERCAAPDIMGPVFAAGIEKNAKHFFYGGKDDNVLAMLKANLERDYPGIQIVGMYSPPFRPLTEEEDKAICEEINRVQPDFLWVGIGAPKQEMWMWKHQEKIKGAVMLGVGAGFDFLAGTLAKAPAWMEEASMEWLFRLWKEPKRLWKRYLVGGMKYLYYSVEAMFKR